MYDESAFVTQIVAARLVENFIRLFGIPALREIGECYVPASSFSGFYVGLCHREFNGL